MEGPNYYIPRHAIWPDSVEVVEEVLGEIERARTLRDAGKFPSTAEDMIADTGNELLAYCVLAEEFGEIAKAMNECASIADHRDEWVQVAAVAIAAIMGFDRRYPEARRGHL